MGLRILVTGTDTGVGKTTVCGAILRAHPHAFYFKPLETGVSGGESEELASLRRLAPSARNLYVHQLFSLPVAPLVASEEEGRAISLAELDARVEELSSRSQLLLIEGAGGLLVPITPEVRYLELALRWQCAALLVVGNRLGCLNHTFLTVEVLKSRGVPFQGWILNDLDPSRDPAKERNLATLTRFLGPPLARVPYPLPQNFTLPLL